ncbi:oligopeptidase A [Cobetia marina]|jgi:oligopeptidase A|uniref:oligopeptidase A n=1 Tax=Cobetia marina TaxID=28258 RepID=A0ABU9GJU2_COBMA|nr:MULTISPECIES: oligopeptidase A [Cobetia]AOM00067.1 oligopeptidase A [Cobetia marina]AZV30173.1 oligopeptidase A [Cobetia sp. ICG0124]MDH2291601.1 oligopeptidase A [Cobetia sp. 10Alg 146]MDH2374133.1 oligopeptidase A [Cobetia sp. 3AK]MDN2656467.1 oligopeptidase A [Cobetia sp. 14N.309.X.WAT.E.A4]
MSINPLLERNTLPPFDTLKAEHVEDAISELLEHNQQEIERLIEATRDDTRWDNFAAPLEALGDRLSQAWSPVSHLNSTMNSPKLREAYQACLAKLSAYSTWVGQNSDLAAAYQRLADSDEFASLDEAQQKAITNSLRDFRLAGVDLPQDKKQRYGEIQARLSELSNTFSNHVLDATQAWHKDVEEEALAGVPESGLAALKANAEAKGLEGYRITLDFPSFFPVLSYADNRELREEVYTAFVTRASEKGPNAGDFDNGPVIEEILALRQELARLIGFDDYASLSLATKMADSPAQVISFLEDLATRAVPQAREEFNELAAYATESLGIDDLQPWDVGYASEKLRESRYAINQEQLRPYFPAPQAIDGLFEVVNRLYGITFQQREVPVWHDDVSYYEVIENDTPIAGFYLDLYAREGKRGGAWMDECRVRRRREDGSLQLPVAYLTCNFTRPVGGRPALLTHDEVVTLFHEFGHGLHHMLTRQEVAEVSGINGVAWDAVELPSQFMENFCYEREGLDLIARHVDTGERLPDDMLERLQAARNFQAAMTMVRQLEFSLFDFRLHHELDTPSAGDVQTLLDEVRSKVAVVPAVEFNRFQNGFSHIFAGGYAAGYYSYKWAEVLSADAFSAFEESAVFDTATGQRFREEVLAKGGSRDAAELFRAFRGRDPQVDALLRHSGIGAQAA